MNDNLDKQLEAWKEQRSPKDAHFTSEEKIASDFFEKASQLPAEKVAKKTFWPVVCKLAACVAVILCLVVMLLKQNKKNEAAVARNVSLAKSVQTESLEAKMEQNDEVVEADAEAAETKPVMMNVAAKRKEADSDDRAAMKEKRAVLMALKPSMLSVESMTEQAEEVEEVVTETVASQPVMAKAILKAKLADSDSDLALMASKPASLPVTAPMANAPIVVNDDAIALDGNGELRVLGTKEIGNVNITGLDRDNLVKDGYLVDYNYNKSKEEIAGNDFLTDDDLADIANDSYNKANEFVASKVLESQAWDISLTNTGGNVDITSLGTALTVGKNVIGGNANVTTDREKVGYYRENIGDETAIKVDTADVADVADILRDTLHISEINIYTDDTAVLYDDGNDLEVRKEQVSTPRKDLHVSTTSTSSNDLAVKKKQVSTPRKDLHVSAASTSSNDLAVRKRQVSTPSSLNTEEYKNVGEKPFLTVSANPLSTFGADVDTAGYGRMRLMILRVHRLPSSTVVRMEELLNYFHYDYPMPEKDEMMRPHFEMQAAPWNPSHQLLLVGVQAKAIPVEELPQETRRIFVKGTTSSMVTICRDVKFQLEFNPSKVFAYRQLGYELRKKASSEFHDAAKDSGDVGMGQQVTVLYELVPADASEDVKKQAVPGWQPLEYAKTEAIANDEWLTFRMRYKLPQGDAPAVEKTTALTNPPAATDNWNWAASVAETSLKLRRSSYAGDANYERAAKRAQTALGDDADGQRAEFLLLIHRIQELDAK